MNAEYEVKFENIKVFDIDGNITYEPMKVITIANPTKVVENPTKKVKLILEDEVEGMMAEDVNVLIKEEQNKKKYWMPEDCWNIVKEHLMFPSYYTRMINARIGGIYTGNLCLGGYNREFHRYPNLQRYLINARKTGKIALNDNDYFKHLLLVANSRAQKAKIELRCYLNDKEDDALQRAKEKRFEAYHSNDEEDVRWRNHFLNKEKTENWMKRIGYRWEAEYEEYKNWRAEIIRLCVV